MIKNSKFFLKKIISVLLMCLCINLFLVGCKDKVSDENTSKGKNVTEQTDKGENNKKSKETNVDKPKKLDEVTIEKKEINNKDYKEEKDTTWKQSKNNQFSVAIKGRGKDNNQEGMGTIVVKDKENKKWSISVKSDKKYTPKNLLWVDDENILVVIGSAYGTVSKGGDLYNINVKTNKMSVIYKRKDFKKEVISVKKLDDNYIVLNINVFEDDNFLKSHKEEKKMSYKEIKEIISKNN